MKIILYKSDILENYLIHRFDCYTMEKISVDIPKRLTDIFGDDIDRIVQDMLDKRSDKLKLIQKIKKMNLPVDDWETMEEETIKGATG